MTRPTHWLARFHAGLQWHTGPQLWWFELLIFVVLWFMVAGRLWHPGS